MQRMRRENAPGNKVFSVVFEGPDMLAQFGGVSVFRVAERCDVVTVSCFEVVLCESDVRSVVLLSLCVMVAWKMTDGCRQFPSSLHLSFCWQLHILLLHVLVAVVLSDCIDQVLCLFMQE